ncbi:hypothetical protein CTEN210_03586 [Chaetoceros tenuissimus]|uniref:Uncharacterized protein n=1 Tax=Chaetoceros tenuissimus TaxID=426638 RepID=A0AAD3CJM9_9STRA|nr:hypothetical protein CTEN210_03586 [Chaetoceros tenuissimus]
MKISTGFLLASASLVQGFSSSSLSLRPLTVNHVSSASVAPSHSWSPSSKLFAETQMNTEVIDESLREEDPIEFIAQEVQVMNVNAIINTAIIVLVAIAVLNQVATVDSGLMRGWTTEETLLRMPIDNWNSYSDILAQAPLQTKAATSATVYTIGDFIAQRTEGRDMGQLDRPRLIRSLLAGLIGHGPLSHIWYDVSEDLFENVLHLKDWWGTVVKVVIDQTTWGPFWNNTYILLLGLMKMDKLENIFGEMKRTTIPLIVSGLKLWPLAHCVTYGLVPVENRLLWVDLVEIIWVTILATAAAGGNDGEEKEGLH